METNVEIKRKKRRTIEVLLYLGDGIFSGQSTWKRMLKSNVKNGAVATWHTRISAPKSNRFKSIHTDFQPNILCFFFSKEKRKLLAPCTSVIQMIPNLNRGWSGGAMVLGSLTVPMRPTTWIRVGQGPTG